jgi:hypothetical protein
MEISPPSDQSRWGYLNKLIQLTIMTQTTDTDIREIKTAIDTLAKATEANIRVIDTLSTRVDAITTATEANTKAIADLTTVVTGIREEMRVGFAKLEGKIDTSEAKLEGKINQLDERTKLGFWGFIFRGTALAALAALTAIFIKYLFPILPELPKP